MRILLTTDTFANVWGFTRALCGELLQRGHAVALVSFGQQPSYEQQAWTALQSKLYGSAFEFVASNAPLEWMQNNEFVLKQGAGVLHHVARDFRPDLLHSSQFCYGALRLDVPKLITAHTDVFSWVEACRTCKLDESRWLRQYRTLMTQGLSGANAVVSPTRWMATSLSRHHAKLPPSYVIRHGRSPSTTAESHLRTMQAVTVGKLWDETKNVRMFQDVLSPIPICVVGERKHGHAVAPRQLGKAILTGALTEPELLSLYARSTIYIDTSVYEPGGMQPLDAALSGCAVVARDIPAVRETWGDAALYFRGARELSSILQRLNHDSAELAEMQRRSLRRAMELTPQRMTDGYEAMYKMLLANKPAEVSLPMEDRRLIAHAA